MFDELREGISRLFSSRWPSCDGVITAIEIQPAIVSWSGGHAQLIIAYQFSVEDEDYANEYSWCPALSNRVSSAKEQLKIGQTVTVRYRADDPSVNTLDRLMWENF